MTTKNLKKNILHFLGNNFLGFVIRVLCKTVKYEVRNKTSVQDLYDKSQNFVLAFWHGTMLTPWYLHRRKSFSAIVSASKDGEVLTRILKKWQYKVARGSSHKGGKDALEKLLALAEKGKSIAITPDGPTGPVNVMKPGAVITAKKSQIPLVLVGIGYKDFYELKSWDKFNIPKFFTSAQVIYSDPIWIDPELSFEQTDKKIKDCEEILNNLQKEAKIFD